MDKGNINIKSLKKKRRLTKDEFRALMPEKINKLGEWVLENKEAWIYPNGKLYIR